MVIKAKKKKNPKVLQELETLQQQVIFAGALVETDHVGLWYSDMGVTWA